MEQVSATHVFQQRGESDRFGGISPCPGPAREYCAVDLYDDSGQWVDSMIREGDEDSILLDMREIALFMARSHCSHVLLRHGHPSGIARPSRADILTTRAFATLARLLGLALHDHVITAGNARFSFRDAGLL